MNNQGQLGINLRDSPVFVPHHVRSMLHIPVVSIVGGGQHSACLTQAGHLLTWGSNRYGQLGSSLDDVKCRLFLKISLFAGR